MKTKIVIFSLIYLMISSFIWSLKKTNTGDIILIVQDLKHSNGQIIISLHAPFEGKFPNDQAIIKTGKALIRNRTAIIEFKDVEYGNYAFAVHHDENDNGKMDTGFMGMPKEGWAFSNNSKGLIGPPDFIKAKFELKSEKLEMSIKMNYL